ncbi:MAG TPA: hypothetical protein DC042_06290 [Bacteroidales bacterium]|nr:hypothetical protein [Bacteroidales bacterium]
MKVNQLIIIALPSLFLLSSCGNDIDLFREGQEKTYVVFGLLNSSSTLQQVKVRLTSITDASVTDISLDSSEFSAPENLQVSIQEWHQNYYATYPLEPVRYSKEPGVFLNTRNDVFETRITPYPDMEYKLIITNPDNGDLVTSKIVPVPEPELGAPTWSWIRYNFSDTVNPFNIRFKEVPRVYVYLIRFTIHYIEVYANGDTLRKQASHVFRPRYVDKPPVYNPIRENFGNEYNRSMNKRYTYNVFETVIPDFSLVSFRQLICFEVSVWGGDQNLRSYTEFGAKFNDNRKNFLNNVNNGIGFFAACSNKGCMGILPDQEFMDSLSIYPRTAFLKFRKDLFITDRSLETPSNVPFSTLIREVGDVE